MTGSVIVNEMGWHRLRYGMHMHGPRGDTFDRHAIHDGMLAGQGVGQRRRQNAEHVDQGGEPPGLPALLRGELDEHSGFAASGRASRSSDHIREK